MKAIPDDLRRQFEENGLESTRLMVAQHRYSHDVELQAIKWLAEKTKEVHLRDEASQSLQIRTALSAKRAAWIAAIAAIIAAIAAIVTIFVELKK